MYNKVSTTEENRISDHIPRDGSAIINETPDTVILTNNRGTDDSQSTQTQDTVLLTRNQTLSEEDQTQGDSILNEGPDEKGTDEQKDTAKAAETVERAQPGFMEEDCGFLMLSRYGPWLDSAFFAPFVKECPITGTRSGLRHYFRTPEFQSVSDPGHHLVLLHSHPEQSISSN